MKCSLDLLCGHCNYYKASLLPWQGCEVKHVGFLERSRYLKLGGASFRATLGLGTRISLRLEDPPVDGISVLFPVGASGIDQIDPELDGPPPSPI